MVIKNVSLSLFVSKETGMSNVQLHLYKTSYHTYKSIAPYLTNLQMGVTCISIKERSGNSPDASSVRLCSFGLLKQTFEHPINEY